MPGWSTRPALMALACLCFTGCVHVGQQQQQPWRLFTLSPLPEPGAEQAATTNSPEATQPTAGLGPIHLPGYLDQDQIVTRISQNAVSLSDDDRWAESLEDNIDQVLAHNLSALLRTDRVRLHSWPARERPIYQLEIDVLSFETDTAGTAYLAARWFLRDVASRQTMAEKETRLSVSRAGTRRNAGGAHDADRGGQAGGVNLGIGGSTSHFEVRDTGSGPVARRSSGWLGLLVVLRDV
jgi:uncharacterized protein